MWDDITNSPPVEGTPKAGGGCSCGGVRQRRGVVPPVEGYAKGRGWLLLWRGTLKAGDGS
ncbi:MAG: hypothetical protein R2880_01050 [Deinococcales bacterium]